MHPNTFKPHTGTKTSILFLQKWNEDPKIIGTLCPHLEDYPIFFATSEYGGKDNSGEYIYLKDSNGQELLDLNGHQIVDQDLYDIREVLKNQLDHLLENHKGNETECSKYQKEYERLLQYLPKRPTIAEAFRAFAKSQHLSFY